MTDADVMVVDAGIPDLMSVTEVAGLYGVSRTAVKKMINTGRLPARMAGATYVIRREVAEGLTVDGDVMATDAPPVA